MEALREFFLTILNMNLVLVIVISAVLILRFLIQKAPAKYRFYLWGIVAFRMLSPISFSSMFSLFQTGKTQEARLLLLPEPLLEQVQHPASISSLAGTATIETAVKQNTFDILSILATVWLTGCILMLVYGIYSYHKLKKQLATAVRMRENIFYSDDISSPFVFGIMRPRIYMPYHLTAQEEIFIIEHEKMHIQRSDHIRKQTVYYMACIHWFNPLIWIGYHFFERDMEMACDEAVLQKIGLKNRCAYSDTLLHMAMYHHRPVYAPLSFGETSVKERIHHILNYSKPRKIIIALIGSILIVSGVLLLSNPKIESPASSWKEEVAQVRQYFDVSIKEEEKVDALLQLLHHPKGAQYTWERLPGILNNGKMDQVICITYTNLDKDYVDQNWYPIQRLMYENMHYLRNIMRDLDGISYKENNGLLDHLFPRRAYVSLNTIEQRVDEMDRGLPDISQYIEECKDNLMCQPYTIDEESLKNQGFYILKDGALSKEDFASFLQKVEDRIDTRLYFMTYTKEGYPILKALNFMFLENSYWGPNHNYFDLDIDISRDLASDAMSYGKGGHPFLQAFTMEDGVQRVYLTMEEAASVAELSEENSTYVFDVR